MKKNKLLYTGSEWSFEDLERVWAKIDEIATKDFGLTYYPVQFEVISAEQMLDNYSSVAMPINYSHWSFGKSFLQNQQSYEKGHSGLAYEVVINTNPCIAYLMENNTMTMQALVMAHAGCGHNFVFKNNYLFKKWTDADSILEYLKYARNYIKDCEEKYGQHKVEILLDACHSLQNFGIDKYDKPRVNKKILSEKRRVFSDNEDQQFNDIWRTLPKQEEIAEIPSTKNYLLPEENILYFIEKHSPCLKEWEKEIVRIVRTIAQYFYPQMQSSLIHEGTATFIHYHIMTALFDQGYIDGGAYLEFLQSHTSVTLQPVWNDERYQFNGINIYALGFAMMQDIKRMCENPDEEDKRYFPDICNTDWRKTIRHIVENYRDESFVSQFLSLKVIKQFQLFSIHIDQNTNYYEVTHVQEEEHMKNIRNILSSMYDISQRLPQIEIVKVNWDTDRALYLAHYIKNESDLHHKEATQTRSYLEYLWGRDVFIDYVDEMDEESDDND